MLDAQGSSHGCQGPNLSENPTGCPPHMLEVRLGLYLGGTVANAKLDQLRVAGITAVLMVDSEEPGFTAGAGVESLRSLFLPALDKPETDLLSHLDQCVAFIHQTCLEGRAVLVHCHAGVTGSVVVVTAFVRKTDQLSFEEAYESLRPIQPEAQMNEGFQWQLKLYQAMGYEMDTSSTMYKQYRLQNVTEKYPELQNLPQELFAVDPATASQGLKDEILYKCRKCSFFVQNAVPSWVPSTGMVNSAHVEDG
ncbi:dual specificity protein phosphatase 12-like [Ochotona princeps]|uniref:dual specificity protein phosphatase 12-like n=1 Tax=Ochotona princeps TaxID=9978 RepID=UPI0027148A7B|nr:dual specificity protein phosphatase 12-like [Ochotona princeps]